MESQNPVLSLTVVLVRDHNLSGSKFRVENFGIVDVLDPFIVEERLGVKRVDTLHRLLSKVKCPSDTPKGFP